MTWNILHGGGATRMPLIALTVLDAAPDVVALTEFRSTVGGQIAGVLADHGYVHQLSTNLSTKRNGIFMASRFPLERSRNAGPGDLWSGRWLEATCPALGVRIATVHVPDDTRPGDKAAYWQFLIDYARKYKDTRAVVCGDFNTGRRFADASSDTGFGRFGCERLLGAFCSIGFRDAFRQKHQDSREFSWYSPWGQGLRIDGAYVSKPLHARVSEAGYVHEARENRVSDHSPFVLRLSISPQKRGENRVVQASETKMSKNLDVFDPSL